MNTGFFKSGSLTSDLESILFPSLSSTVSPTQSPPPIDYFADIFTSFEQAVSSEDHPLQAIPNMSKRGRSVSSASRSGANDLSRRSSSMSRPNGGSTPLSHNSRQASPHRDNSLGQINPNQSSTIHGGHNADFQSLMMLAQTVAQQEPSTSNPHSMVSSAPASQNGFNPFYLQGGLAQNTQDSHSWSNPFSTTTHHSTFHSPLASTSQPTSALGVRDSAYSNPSGEHSSYMNQSAQSFSTPAQQPTASPPSGFPAAAQGMTIQNLQSAVWMLWMQLQLQQRQQQLGQTPWASSNPGMPSPPIASHQAPPLMPSTQPTAIPPARSNDRTRDSSRVTSPTGDEDATTTTDAANDEEEAPEVVIEDKRRRNTAASARFRVKKKLRNAEIARTVAQLERRAMELETEAESLKRENGWLKDMVLLKGRRNMMMMNQVQAPAQSESAPGKVGEGSSSAKDTTK